MGFRNLHEKKEKGISSVFSLFYCLPARTKDQRQKDQRHMEFLHSLEQVFKSQEAKAVQSFEVCISMLGQTMQNMIQFGIVSK